MHAAILLWVASFAHLVSGNVDLALAGTILIGSIPGVWIGSALAARAPAAWLRPTLAIVLIASGMGLLSKAGLAVPAAVLIGVPMALAIVTVLVARSRAGSVSMPEQPKRSSNVVWQAGELTREDRWRALGGPGGTVWFTGLPASGKSSVAKAVEARLLARGHPAYMLDGDNLRHGLNGDLGFSPEDRAENVRRTAEVAALLADAGTVALVSLGRPFVRRRPGGRARHPRARRAALPRGLGVARRWRSASGAIPRACTRRRARASCRTSRA